MPEEGRKRSRFDQTEPEPKRQSRFDRRSRSPSARQSEVLRSRSPLNRQDSDSPATAEKKDPAAAAAAAAARINAQIQARKGIQHVDVPPIRSTASPVTAKSPSGGDSTNPSGEVYQQDGDYIKDIEVNDLRNRYTLTKGSTQKMVNTSDHNLLILSGTCTHAPLAHSSLYRFPVFFYPLCSVANYLWKARRSSLNLAAVPSNSRLAPADLTRVTSRSKKRLAPVRSTTEQTYVDYRILLSGVKMSQPAESTIPIKA